MPWKRRELGLLIGRWAVTIKELSKLKATQECGLTLRKTTDTEHRHGDRHKEGEKYLIITKYSCLGSKERHFRRKLKGFFYLWLTVTPISEDWSSSCMFSNALPVTTRALIHNRITDFCIIIYFCKHKIANIVLIFFEI